FESAVGESRTPTIVRSPEPESESLLNHRRELAPWRGQPPHGGTERHAPPRPSGGKGGGRGSTRKGGWNGPPGCRAGGDLRAHEPRHGAERTRNGDQVGVIYGGRPRCGG